MQFLALAPPGPAGPHPGSRFSVGKEQLRREGSRRGRFVSRHPSSSAGITFNVVCGRDDGHRRSELQPAETATRRRSCSRGAMVEPRILARIWRWGMFGSMLVQRIAPRSVCHPPSVRPLLVFDGECPFCRQWVEYVTVGECFDIESFQSAAARFPELAPAQFEQAVQLIQTDGRVFSAAEAVLRAWALATSRGWLLAGYQRLPGFALAMEAIYRAIARSRPLFSWLTRVFFRATLPTP